MTYRELMTAVYRNLGVPEHKIKEHMGGLCLINPAVAERRVDLRPGISEGQAISGFTEIFRKIHNKYSQEELNEIVKQAMRDELDEMSKN